MEALDQDRDEQVRVSEERMAQALREQRAALKVRRQRRLELVKQVFGEGALFGQTSDGCFASVRIAPAPHAEAAIAAYDSLLGLGGESAWREVEGARPRLAGLCGPCRLRE